MAVRTRLTPFARLLFFLLVFVPLAYFGAAYYNNEDPMAKIKGWFPQMTGGSAAKSSGNSQASCAENLEALKRENYQLKQDLLKKTEELRILQGASGGNSGPQKWGK